MCNSKLLNVCNQCERRIGFDNDRAPCMWQAIIWTNSNIFCERLISQPMIIDDPVHWCSSASLHCNIDLVILLQIILFETLCSKTTFLVVTVTISIKVVRNHIFVESYIYVEVGNTNHFNGSVQERCNSIANAMELRLSCTKTSICYLTSTKIWHMSQENMMLQNETTKQPGHDES